MFILLAMAGLPGRIVVVAPAIVIGDEDGLGRFGPKYFAIYTHIDNIAAAENYLVSLHAIPNAVFDAVQVGLAEKIGGYQRGILG